LLPCRGARHTREAGYTVSLEWRRDTGETRIVVADSRDASVLVFLVPGAYAGDAPTSVQVRSVSTRGEHGVAMRPMAAELTGALRPPEGSAATFATTEHFNLQTARALTVSDANGRASIYSPRCRAT
jgi:hypothetical protein